MSFPSSFSPSLFCDIQDGKGMDFVRGEHFQLGLKILPLMMHHLKWNPEYSNDPSQPMWQEDDDARDQGLSSLLCDSRTLIDCTLWVWTPPPLSGYAEKSSWGFEESYTYRDSRMKCLLIIHFYPLWNSLSLHCNLRSKLFGVVETHDKHMLLKVRMPSV